MSNEIHVVLWVKLILTFRKIIIVDRGMDGFDDGAADANDG